MPLDIKISNPLRQYLELQDEIDRAIARVIAGGLFTPGPEVAAFEREFAEWMGIRHAIGVASGSSALILALKALGVSSGDRVAAAANQDISAVAPISQCGAEPLWIDIDESTHSMSAADLRSKITPATRAVIVVHNNGIPAAMADLKAVTDAAGIPLIEDATLGPGALASGAKVGAVGAAGCFSLAPTKPLAALGNAGVVVTDSDEIAHDVRVHSNYGFDLDSVERIRRGEPAAPFHYVAAGMNATMDELQAAVLRVKLGHIDDWAVRRRAHADIYRAALEGGNLRTPAAVGGDVAAPRSYVIRHPRRAELARALHELGIATAVNYYPPLHTQAPYGEADDKGTLPITEKVTSELLCLPVGPELRRDEVERAAESVRKAVLALAT